MDIVEVVIFFLFYWYVFLFDVFKRILRNDLKFWKLLLIVYDLDLDYYRNNRNISRN